MDRRVGRRLLAAPGGESSWLSGRGLELEENYNSTGVCTAQIPDNIHLPVGSEVVEGLGLAVTFRLGATFFGHIDFLNDTMGIVGEGGKDPEPELLVKKIGELGTRDGVERVESATGERKKVSEWGSSFISRPSFGFPTPSS